MLALLTPILAAIDGQDLLSMLVQIVIIGLICWLLFWFIGWCAIPEPFNKVARVIIGLFILIFLINLLMGMSGHPMVEWNHHHERLN
jgi:hypothetical protein